MVTFDVARVLLLKVVRVALEHARVWLDNVDIYAVGTERVVIIDTFEADNVLLLNVVMLANGVLKEFFNIALDVDSVWLDKVVMIAWGVCSKVAMEALEADNMLLLKIDTVMLDAVIDWLYRLDVYALFI